MSTFEQAVRAILADALYMAGKCSYHCWVLPSGRDRLSAARGLEFWNRRIERAEWVLRMRYGAA